jgi:hypothetical protein
LDTRTKIVDALEAGMEKDATLVRGYFDPLLAEHAIFLAGLEAPVVVLLEDPPEPLLDRRSRAELVAALGAVDRVVVGKVTVAAEGRVIDRREADLRSRAALVEHVHRRHR